MDLKDYLLNCYIETNGETFTKELAISIVTELAITDGTSRNTGEKWTIAECEEMGKKYGIDFSVIPVIDWYVVMNLMYSDYYSVGKKYCKNNNQFYEELSMAWFYDVDAEENKTFHFFFGHPC